MENQKKTYDVKWFLDQLFMKAVGMDLFPEADRLASFRRVLDIGCGPGDWALSLAKQYPHLSVIGIDQHQHMIDGAQVLARREGIGNVQFEVMNVFEPLAFPDEHFDLVNMRFAVGRIPASYWPDVLRECHRVLRPGTCLHLVETDHLGVSTCGAFDLLTFWIAQLYQKRNYGFSSSGSNFCITSALKYLLSREGFTSMNRHPFVVEILPDAENRQNILTMLTGLQELIQADITTPEQFRRLENSLREALQGETFCALLYGLIMWAIKPQR